MESTTTTTKIKDRGLKRSHSSGAVCSNRFLLCFRPVITGKDVSVAHDRSSMGASGGEPFFTYVTMGQKEGMMFPAVPPAVSSDKGGDKQRDVSQKKKGGLRRFSRLFKAVFFETSLAKKVARRKIEKRSSKSSRKKPGKTDKISDENELPQQLSQDEITRPTSNVLSSSSSSSLRFSSAVTSSSSRSSALPWNSRSSSLRCGPNSIEWKQRQGDLQERREGCYGLDSCFCLLLVTLFVLVFWGKIFAIFCTSAWLFLVPRRSKANNSRETGFGSPEIGSEEQKKKMIIMEGLLDRRHSRAL